MQPRLEIRAVNLLVAVEVAGGFFETFPRRMKFRPSRALQAAMLDDEQGPLIPDPMVPRSRRRTERAPCRVDRALRARP